MKCPTHPDARTMPSACAKKKWGRYVRCDRRHGFYVEDGKVTHVTKHKGGPAVKPIPCGVCGEQTYAKATATRSGVPVVYRWCFDLHVGLYRADTGEFLDTPLTPERMRVTECHGCGADVTKKRTGWCHACGKKRTRDIRIYRDTHRCSCGRKTANTGLAAGEKKTRPALVTRECMRGHRSLWSDGGRVFFKLARKMKKRERSKT